LTKRLRMLVIFAAIMVVPTMIFAGGYHQFEVAKAEAKDARTMVVPLNITNEDNLAAINIPLKFSEGVTLREVTYENTRVDYFQLKIANINNEENTVVIGLLPQISPTPAPDLKAGTGTVANLVFEIDDPSVTDVELEAIVLKNPDHELMFVYRDLSEKSGLRTERPEFERVSVALSGISAETMPNTFGLSQNYPNPFNPTTTIAFNLSQASDYTLNVYNIAGQRVESFQGKGEAGENSVVWEASGFASGVYFYKLEAEGQSETKKMMLLK